MDKGIKSTLARKYAKAFLVYGDCYAQDVDFLVRLCTLVDFLGRYRTRFFHAKREQYIKLFESFDVGKLGLLLDLLVAHKRLFLLREVLQLMTVLYKEHNNIELCSMKSSHNLDEKQRNQIQKFLEHETGKQIVYSYVQDRKLIAGIRIEGDTFVWEDSIASKLRMIQLS